MGAHQQPFIQFLIIHPWYFWINATLEQWKFVFCIMTIGPMGFESMGLSQSHTYGLSEQWAVSIHLLCLAPSSLLALVSADLNNHNILPWIAAWEEAELAEWKATKVFPLIFCCHLSSLTHSPCMTDEALYQSESPVQRSNQISPKYRYDTPTPHYTLQ